MATGERTGAVAMRAGRRRGVGLPLAAWAVAAVLLAGAAAAQSPRGRIPLDGQSPESMDEVARQIANPVRSLWTLTLDHEITLERGGGLDGVEPAYVGSFEPLMPVNLSKLGLSRFDWAERYSLLTQLSIPFVETLPVPASAGDRRSGFGDIQLVTAVAPAVREGLVWGLGPSFIFPSASSDALGQGKWQAGPAAVLGYGSRKWVAFVFGQQWWSFAGDGDRPRTSQLSLEYALLRLLPGRWQVGMQPTLAVDWTAPAGKRVSFPVGLGAGKTIRIGKYPVQFWLEADYYPVRQAGPTPRWGFSFQITPTIPEPD